MSSSQVDAFWSPNELSAIRAALEDLQQQANLNHISLKAKKLWKFFICQKLLNITICNYMSAFSAYETHATTNQMQQLSYDGAYPHPKTS